MPPKESATPEPGLSMQTAFDYLVGAYREHQAGKPVNPQEVAQNLTCLYQGLEPEYRKRPGMIRIMRTCGKLAIDHETDKQLISDPNLLRLIYPSDRKPKYSLRTKATLALGIGTVAVGGTVGILFKEMADLKANGGPAPITYDGSKLFRDSQTLIFEPANAATATPAKNPSLTAQPTARPTATAEVAQKPPENLFNEFLKPFVEEAMMRRKQLLEADPEYARVIDRQLNENRLNIVVFGYWEEHDETYEDYGGTPSVLSLDLKTNKIAVINFTRDIRAPELERLLPEGQRKPLSLRNVYRAGGKGEGGFKQLRYQIGAMSGLIADYQIVMKDMVLRDVIVKLAEGKLEIDVPKDHETGSFKLDRVQYGEGLIREGWQVMDAATAMRYAMAEDVNPQGKEDERSYRKNQVTEALLAKVRSAFKNKSLFDKIGYLNQIKSLFEEEVKSKNLEPEFSMNLVSRSFEGIFSIARRFLTSWGQNIELAMPEIDQEKGIVFSDPYFGDGGVTRSPTIANAPDMAGRGDKPHVIEEIRAHKLPDWMMIPDGGDPYADDLAGEYWQVLRAMVREKLAP